MVAAFRYVVLVITLVLHGGSVAAQGPARDISVEAMRTERRVALVIGNSAYPSSPLKNPVNDARDMSRTLKALGFDVMAHENLNQRDMKLVVTEFGRRLRGSDVGLFFFAGHGMQVNGRNFLVPVDAAPNSEDEVDADSIDVASVLGRMAGAKNRLNVVILDACRDNPFGRSFRSTARGLAFVDAPTGTLIAYATGPGKVARDGDGKNGLYTGELLKVLPVPGVKLEDVFKQVRQAVQRATNGDQVPWEASSVVGDFVFALPAAGQGQRVAVAPAPTPAPPPITTEIERAFGTLAIQGKLAGIEIWLGDQRLGETPAGGALVVRNVPVGTHRLRARKAGQKHWERDVEVVANQRADVTIDIEPLRPEVASPAIVGTWRGTSLYYRGAGVPIDFTVTISGEPQQFSGRMSEPATFGDGRSPNLYADIRGNVSAARRVTFVKTYDGTGGVSHSVTYEGTLDEAGRTIQGQWVVGTMSGTFRMLKQ